MGFLFYNDFLIKKYNCIGVDGLHNFFLFTSNLCKLIEKSFNINGIIYNY